MAKETSSFICSECGNKQSKWLGKCPICGKWNTYEEVTMSSTAAKAIKSTTVVKLKDLVVSNDLRIITGDTEIDKMFGGGIVKDSVNILTAPPGSGKSTFALNLAQKLGKLGITVLYASGEESESQIKSRANRILGSSEICDNIYVISSTSTDEILGTASICHPGFIIIDSIQTVCLERCLPSRAGSPTQIMESIHDIIAFCKNKAAPAAALVIGQMVKDDELAGPRQLEHIVDAVFYLDGDPYENLRVCTSSKNRFGELETVFFDIYEGMSSVANPSDYLLTKRSPGTEVSGSAISIIKEGTRPLAIEIESLVSASYQPYPSRLGDGLRKEQLNILTSILDQHTKINLYNKNVVVKGVGGVRLQENSVNLAILMSIASAFYKRPLPIDTVYIGEVGLTGEVKKIQSLESKVKEAERLGFKTIVIPEQTLKGTYKIKIVKIKTINEAMSCFGKELVNDVKSISNG